MVFVKAAARRADCLREYPLGEFPLHRILIREMVFRKREDVKNY